MIRLRPAAFLSASTALVILGWWSFRPTPNQLAQVKRITLWTAGADTDESRVSNATVHVALPGATAPAGALQLEDAAGLRRRLPALEQVEIRGDGVDSIDATALRPLSILAEAQVIFDDARERITLPVPTPTLTPEIGHARSWPTSPGWHDVQSPGG